MTAIFGEGYFCSCQKRDHCDESCPVYRARENDKDDDDYSIDFEIQHVSYTAEQCGYDK